MKNSIFLFVFILMSSNASFSQSVITYLYHSYDSFLDRGIVQRIFTSEEYHSLLLPKVQSPLYHYERAGSSVNGTAIYLIKTGNGPITVFLWSQMHGDEPTASQALLDFFNFMNDPTSFLPLKTKIRRELTLYIMPMVNPDGADKVTRRNEQDIDINRDVIRLQTPEGKLLLETFLKIRPQFAFNLHDQNPRYSVGNSKFTAALSFLAPAPNIRKDVPLNRLRAMQLIGSLTETLNKFIPGHIAKYDDEYEPRAFGDKFQELGAATILIESGGWKNDPEKQFLRKLNFLSYIFCLQKIAENTIDEASSDSYNNLPFNQKNHFDLIIRNATLTLSDSTFIADVAVNRNERVSPDKRSFLINGVTEDIGHLTGFYGLDEIDASGMEILPGKIYDISNSELPEEKKLKELLQQGYTTLRFPVGIQPKTRSEQYPLLIVYSNDTSYTHAVGIGRGAHFVLYRNNKAEYSIVNGKVINLLQ